MEIIHIPVLESNYVWLIINNKEVVIIDPGSSNEVISYIRNHNLIPRAIWLTHNHDDHTQGVVDIQSYWPTIDIIGPNETSKFNTRTVSEEESFFQFNHLVTIIDTPGHTYGHISFLFENHLFCGDTLFSMGCGRVFTQDYALQFETLQKIKALSDDVLIYCGHEYTITNLNFIYDYIDDSPEILSEIVSCKLKMSLHGLTLPSTISHEKNLNPFLKSESLKDFIKIRKLRDDY